MLKPTGFSSWADYGHFALAHTFVSKETGLTPAKSALERLGQALSMPVLRPLNFLVREIKNPVVILTLTVSLVSMTTLIFYPVQFMLVLSNVFPFLTHVEPWVVKLCLFGAVEATIAGIGLRALARMCNLELKQAWLAQKLEPVHIGAKALASR